VNTSLRLNKSTNQQFSTWPFGQLSFARLTFGRLLQHHIIQQNVFLSSCCPGNITFRIRFFGRKVNMALSSSASNSARLQTVSGWRRKCCRRRTPARPRRRRSSRNWTTTTNWICDSTTSCRGTPAGNGYKLLLRRHRRWQLLCRLTEAFFQPSQLFTSKTRKLVAL